jgi:hypothetical protein
MNPAPYRVVWKRSATEIQLVGIVNRLIERNEPIEPVTRAMDRLDQLLSINPNGVGESRPNFERILTESPLTVWYAVHDDERMVYVLAVNYTVPRHLRG